MAIFVRKSRRGDWDRVAADTPADLAFPANVLADILDNENEVSVWEVSDPPAAAELDTIVAALHARNVSNLTDVTLRVISDWKVKKELGLIMKSTRGESLDTKLNGASKHQVIQINSVGDAIALAKAFKFRDPIFRSQAQVMQAMAAALASGRIQSDAVGSGLIKKLFDAGHIQLALPAPKPASA
ncbi:hypothetical protein WN72_09450 [Bradyrhizobium arachidis]|uniref:Uncharacterized protein n=1 Tax=Bradyrhizobium arachidis TaxID=858423 RepID=A0AAE7NQ24_9BRAD|nr:hypothetical protein WN72_09450 [Bradyrhizobium arachidis]